MKHQCRKCNQCCKPEHDLLLLTPRDTFAIAFQLKIPVDEVLEKYCKKKIVGTFPIVYIKDCPFILKNKCLLSRKPDVCSTFPHGNKLWFRFETEKLIPECDLNDNYDLLLYNDPFHYKWLQALSVCGNQITGMEKESERLAASELAYELLYKNYDITKPFLKQFDENVLMLISKIG